MLKMKKGLPIPTYKGISRIIPTLTIRGLEIPFSGEHLQMDFSILFIKKIKATRRNFCQFISRKTLGDYRKTTFSLCI
jgi:hypothetical protein